MPPFGCKIRPISLTNSSKEKSAAENGIFKGWARLGLSEVALRVVRHRASLDDLAARTAHAFDTRFAKAGDRLQNTGSLLQSYSYQGTLARGFALVRDEEGQPVTSAATASKKSRIEIEFADDRIPALIAAGRPVKPRTKAKKPSAPPGDQGTLL